MINSQQKMKWLKFTWQVKKKWTRPNRNLSTNWSTFPTRKTILKNWNAPRTSKRKSEILRRQKIGIGIESTSQSTVKPRKKIWDRRKGFGDSGKRCHLQMWRSLNSWLNVEFIYKPPPLFSLFFKFIIRVFWPFYIVYLLCMKANVSIHLIFSWMFLLTS